jgi:hypothetical protein
MTRLEDELRAGLAAHAAATPAPARDVFAAATRRHSRRRALQGTALTTGTLSLAAVLAFGLATGGSPAGAPAVVELDAETVAAQVAAALEDADDEIAYTDVHTTLDGSSSRVQIWHDETSRAYRHIGAKIPTAPFYDVATEIENGKQVMTIVDHGKRSWHRLVTPVPDYGGDRPTKEECQSGGPAYRPAGDACAITPEAVRDAMTGDEPAFTVVGKEQIDGRTALHLQYAGELRKKFGDTDLWVDADTYELMRRQVHATDGDGRDLTVREDYRSLDRTDANLAELEADIPAGFTHEADQHRP